MSYLAEAISFFAAVRAAGGGNPAFAGPGSGSHCGMEPAGHMRIPSRSRRQTMDWALVLASQGLEAVIDEGADGAGWGLVVAEADYPAAVEAIRLYRLENRHWHWRQPLPWQGLIFDGRVAAWGLLMIAADWLGRLSRSDIQAAGCMDNAAVRAGEWWRLFTAMLLHADVAHLTANLTLGVVLLGLAMGRYGGGVGLLAASLAGAGGNVASLLVYPASQQSLGASGMVMGGLGLLAAQSLLYLRQNPNSRRSGLRGVLAGAMLFVLFGLSPGTNIMAHLGGFVTGLVLGAGLVRMPSRWQNPRTDLVAWLLYGGLTVTTGWLAFR
jgi:rhomboid protease GluP